jgi:transcriptional regulator with XRE-family HTH domain
MAAGKRSSKIPIPVLRALRKLGQDIRDARRRRRIPVAVMAERASISRTTLGKVEKGDPGVSSGLYATVLFVLGFVERLGDLADPGADELGLALEEEHLPRRIRSPRQPRSNPRGGAQDR